MNVSKVVISDNSLIMDVDCTNIAEGKESLCPMYKIHFIEFQLKMYRQSINVWFIYVKFKKCVEDKLIYTLTVNSSTLKFKSKTFISDHNYWREIGSLTSFLFDIEVNLGIYNFPHLRLVIYDDLADFELKGVDGSIRVNKTVLAAASEVFEKMIADDFKEKEEARVELPYSKSVLKDLKDYLYLNTLNNDNLENLFMLAHCYMMDALKSVCIKKLFYNSVTENVKKEDCETETK